MEKEISANLAAYISGASINTILKHIHEGKLLACYYRNQGNIRPSNLLPWCQAASKDGRCLIYPNYTERLLDWCHDAGT